MEDEVRVSRRGAERWAHGHPWIFAIDRARRMAPSEFVIGASVGDRVEAVRAAGADYWGIGPWNPTGTKEDAGPSLGPDGFRVLTALAEGKPCIAIGGVRPEDVVRVRDAGGVGVAVVSGIFGEKDVEAAARQYAGQLRDRRQATSDR